MKNIAKLISSLSLAQRIATVVAALLVGAGVLLFVNYRTEGDFRPLYTGVAAQDAGAIVQKLREKGIPYRVADHDGSILVPSAKVAETRIEMASAGLPKSGRIGFELFDQTRFGTSDLTERVNLRRAVEGELERSVTTLSAVENARVHVTYPRDSVFAENRLPAKASVMVKLKTGRTLDEQSVAAVRFLLASAVEGLAPESVSVLDMEGHVLGRPKDRSPDDPSENTNAVLEYRRRVEKDLLQRMNETLEALVGPDRYRASVVIDCDFTRGEQSEESFDPSKSVMTTSEKTRESSNGTNLAGVPGTASNLPRPTAPLSYHNDYVKESENVAFQTAHTVRRVRLPEGQVVRMSASVLVDQDLQWVRSGNGYRRVLSPPSQDTLQRITELVSGAIGLDAKRGDRLVVESLPFDATLRQQPPAPAAQEPARFSPAIWIPLAAGVVLLLAGGLVLFARKKRRIVLMPTMPAQIGAAETPEGEAQQLPAVREREPLPVSAGETASEIQKQIEESRRRRAFEKQQLQAAGAVVQEMLKELQESAAGDPALCAGALRSWLIEHEPVAGMERNGN
jgi:flagellar M-ring protein FliF